MKEINLHNPAFGKDKKDRDSSVKNIVSELTIIKEQVSLCLSLLISRKEVGYQWLFLSNMCRILNANEKSSLRTLTFAGQRQPIA